MVFDIDEEDMLDVDDDEEGLSELLRTSTEKVTPSNGVQKRKIRGKVSENVRERVRFVLEDGTKLAEKRARMCDEGDFLNLLWSFNQTGIHFS